MAARSAATSGGAALHARAGGNWFHGVALGALAVLWLVRWALPQTALRAEDFVGLRYYEGASLLDVWFAPHLGSQIASFWRPLGDTWNWLAVQLGGGEPRALHWMTASLHLAVVVTVYRLARRHTVGWVALTVGVCALWHPFAASVVWYVDGGLAQLSATWFTLLGLMVLGEPGPRGLRASAGLLAGAGAALSFDGALPVPFVFGAVTWIAHRSRAWGVAHLAVGLVLVAVRLTVLGSLGGYGGAGLLDSVGERLVGYARLAPLLFAPSFAFPESGGMAFRILETRLLQIVAGAGIFLALCAAWRSVATTDESRAGGRRVLLVSVALTAVALFVPAGLDLATLPDEGWRALPLYVYRLYPPAILALLWLFTAAGGGKRWGRSLALLAPTIALHLACGSTFRGGMLEAGRAAEAIPRAIGELQGAEASRVTVLFATPEEYEFRGRPVARLYQFGLSEACRRADLVERVIPVFYGADDEFLPQFLVTPRAVQALAASPFVRALGYTPPQSIGAVSAKALSDDGLVLRAPDGGVPSGWSDAPIVPIDEAGRMVLRVEGASEPSSVLAVFNTTHTYFAAPHERYRTTLSRRSDPAGGHDLLEVSAPHFREVAERDPDGPALLVLQSIPLRDGDAAQPIWNATRVSQALPVLLRPTTARDP